MHAHSELQLTLAGHVFVAGLDVPLNRDRAAHRVGRRLKFREEVVADEIDNVPAVLRGESFDRFTQRLEVGYGRGLVGNHETAVANNVSRQDGDQLTARIGGDHLLN
jgi:hypothetical protein